MKLKDLTEKIGSGATPRGGKNAYLGGDISLIRSQNVLDSEFSDDGLAYINNEQAAKLDNVTVREGDVLLNITGDSIARCCLAPKEILPARVNQHVSIIRPKKGISSEYLMYWLLFMKHHLLNICKIGGTRNALTKEMLEELDIDYPDDAQRIADALKILDTKIINNKKIIKELEDAARLIYDYWFTQFDFPDENGNPYCSNGGKMVWSDELKREIPEGWEVNRLGELAPLLRPTVQPKAEVVYEHYSIPAFDEGKYPAFEPGSLIDSGKYSITENSLLYSKLNPKFKRLWVPLCLSENLICSTEFLVFEPVNAAVRSYVYGVLDSSMYYAYMVSKAISSTGSRSRVDPEVATDFVIPIPDECLLMRFGNVLSPMLKQIKDLQIQIEELVSLRDWLLPMLMNGQVKVN